MTTTKTVDTKTKNKTARPSAVDALLWQLSRTAEREWKEREELIRNLRWLAKDLACAADDLEKDTSRQPDYAYLGNRSLTHSVDEGCTRIAELRRAQEGLRDVMHMVGHTEQQADCSCDPTKAELCESCAASQKKLHAAK